MKKRDIFFILGFALLILFYIDFASAENSTLQPNGTLTVQANIIGFRIIPSLEGVGIQVSDFIDFGDVTNSSRVTDDQTIYINNTGTVDITVTPQLADENEGIFSYLFFRNYKASSDPEKNKFYRIGVYSLNISKPSSGKTVRTAHCYAALNLTDLNAPIENDLIAYQAKIIFWAMPSS